MAQETETRYYGFTKANLWIFAVSLLLLVIGYVLMSGGESADGVSFDPGVFNFRRIGLAPILCTLGYAGFVPALLYRSKAKSSDKK